MVLTLSLAVVVPVVPVKLVAPLSKGKDLVSGLEEELVPINESSSFDSPGFNFGCSSECLSCDSISNWNCCSSNESCPESWLF